MSKKIKKLAIANRGEVAVRIIRAAQELGMTTVLLHSEPDQKTEAYRLSDEAVCIGGASSSESYLNIESNINAALSVSADAIHPGFGFLSENADFAKACSKAKIIFVGPSSESIELLGDKIRAKKLVEELNVPTLLGYKGENQSIEVLLEKVNEIGFPVIAKATAGGGGRGMKIIKKSADAKEQLLSAKREGLAAFGSDEIFLEKYLDRAKHIEVQIFGEVTGEILCLGERECSVQRRHQKIVEEAPSVSLTDGLRKEIISSAKKVAEAAKYQGAGTVEFLLQDNQFYFLEMNTRLQVEHTVTEEVCSVDLVKAQLICAEGQLVGWDEKSLLNLKGHSIECRIYAEDPYNMGVPSVGLLGKCHWPQGPGRRFEVGLSEGDEMTPFYDSMFAKVIVWDETRSRSIQKMLKVLDETVIFGVKTNIPLLKKIISHPEFVSGVMNTKFIESYFSESLVKTEIDSEMPFEIKNELKKMIDDSEGSLSRSPSSSIQSGLERTSSSLWNEKWRNV